ncbi:hypothetical protein GKQ77_20170 [Streptomyces sp. BG9H]|uniref:Uncharacterized protein n=1 Tax=Streptomyces anatolicus TaxID=2675858 RepID=A0ABS6YTJ8_9ACTN|nr:hypothetical protein [Streptomyces anatolicus]MBW5423851.1 hypothetical protein [Streptomyces anatolicus]
MPGKEDGDLDGFEALMAAITGDPVPEEALRDPAFAAEHAAAVADVALLRERLGILGEALAAPAEPPKTVVPLRPANRVPARGARARGARGRLVTALGAAAVTATAALVGGLGWLAVNGPGAGDDMDSGGGAKDAAAGQSRQDAEGGDTDAEDTDGRDAKLSPEGFVACSRLIVEGEVTAVEPVPGAGRDRITLDVSRYYKPESGDRTITFPMDDDVDPPLDKGDRVLITIPRGETHPDNWPTGKDRDSLRRTVLKALPGAAKVSCESR